MYVCFRIDDKSQIADVNEIEDRLRIEDSIITNLMVRMMMMLILMMILLLLLLSPLL